MRLQLRPPLAQIVAFSVPSHYYLNQCCIIVNWTDRNKRQSNFIQNSNIFIQANAFENIVWKMPFYLGLSMIIVGRIKLYSHEAFISFYFGYINTMNSGDHFAYALSQWSSLSLAGRIHKMIPEILAIFYLRQRRMFSSLLLCLSVRNITEKRMYKFPFYLHDRSDTILGTILVCELTGVHYWFRQFFKMAASKSEISNIFQHI